MGYRSAVKIFKDIEMAVQFLNIIVTEDELLVAAELAFFSYDINAHNLQQVINCFCGQTKEDDIQVLS